ncbi:SDR family oxidoreductase [Shinella zoogloeoides]|uniref:SDR family oxidoreductase n=1 Tax=Shinella zoogloeoides TaxID=352475 RepID=UPI0028B172A7|nr:NAD(P)H-binding protein [Shinella zoogloeoides]
MFIVLGATGHIGSELVRTLDAAGKKVVAVVRNVGKADSIRTANVAPAVLDVENTARLHDLFRRGRRAFLLNPPADPGGNTDASATAMHVRGCRDCLLDGSRLPGETGRYPAQKMGGKPPGRRLLAASSPCLFTDDRSDSRSRSTAGRSFARRCHASGPYQQLERTMTTAGPAP